MLGINNALEITVVYYTPICIVMCIVSREPEVDYETNYFSISQ